MTKKSAIPLVVVGLLLYAAGYAAARQSHWVVHRAGYHTGPEGQPRVAEHRVLAGDFGTPILVPVDSTILALVAVVYLPARTLEALAWQVMVPPGAVWPSEWQLRQLPSHNSLNPTLGSDAALRGEVPGRAA